MPATTRKAMGPDETSIVPLTDFDEHLRRRAAAVRCAGARPHACTQPHTAAA